MVAALLVLFLFPAAVLAHPLLNLNLEDWIVYENLEASEGARFRSVTIKPYSYRKAFLLTDFPERVSLYMNALSQPGYFLKPLNSLTFNAYYTTEEVFALENSGGAVLRRGPGLRTLADGFLSLGSRAVLYYQFLYRKDREEEKLSLHRGYLKLRLWKLSLEAGKDTVHLGPGEFALLLSSHAEPFPLLKIETDRPLNFAGNWDFVLVRGWLRERRRDRSDPSLLALRVVWKPVNLVEIGATRTALYGGEGRPGFKLTEYPKFILGSEENVPSSKFDADGYGAVDVTLYLPLHRLIEGVRSFKIYYQEAGTDIKAWWQKEDRGEFYFPFGFRFLFTSYVAGFLLSTKKHILRGEFTKVSDKWYVHHHYSYEGYTYRGLSLGHPYGSNLLHILFSHRYYLSEKTSLSYRVGAYKQPAYRAKESIRRFYLTLSGEKRLRILIVSAFLRADFSQSRDTDPYPNRFNVVPGRKTFLTLGLSLSWRL